MTALSQPDPVAEAVPTYDGTAHISLVFIIVYISFPKKLTADCDQIRCRKSVVWKMSCIAADALIEFNPLQNRAHIRVVAEDIVAKYPILGTSNTGDTHKCYETISTKFALTNKMVRDGICQGHQ